MGKKCSKCCENYEIENMNKEKKCSEKKCCGRKCCPCKIIGIILISFFVGCLIGVHKNVIKALINGDDMPEAPDWHFWCK